MTTQAPPVIVPTRVTNLEVTPDDGSLMVSWTAASVAPSGYSVRWKKDGTTDPMSPINKVTGTSFTIPDLTRGTRYLVRVYTRNAADNGVQANTAVVGRGTPIGLTFSATALTVAEGLSGTYTVRLAAAPSANVTVTVAGWSNADVTVDTDPGATGNQNMLTFTTTNWYNPKTVTVEAGADDDESDDSVTLTHTAAGGNYASVTGSVAVTVDDDDGPTLSYPALPTVLRAGVQFETLTPMTADFKSGSTFSYAVTTGDLPSGLALDTSTGAISGTPDTPTPTDGSSGASVTVTVTGSTGTGESKQTQTATVTLNFPRIFRFKLPAPTVTLEVGDTQLTANWDAVASADTYALQWKESSVTGWSGTGVTTVDPATPGTVITGLTNGTSYDVRVRSKAASSSTTHADGDWSGGVQGIPATIGLTFSATALTVAEGLSGTYTVKLAVQPSANVTVTIAGWSNTDVTVDTDPGATGNQNTLTFTTTNWDDAKTVTVAAGADDDESDDSVTLTHTAAGGNYASVTGSVAVTVDDDDRPNLSYPALPTVLRAGVQFETLTPMTADFKSGSTFSYAVTTGDLPSGLALDTSTGAISGTPDTPTPADGSSGASVTVTVTGSTGTGESKQTQTATATLDFPRIFRFKLPVPTVTLKVGNRQLTANWDAVANAASYALQWKESSVTGWSGTGVTTVDPATRGTVITGLTNGTSYDVRVRAKAASSSTTHADGDWSGGVQGTPAALTKVTNLKITPGDGFLMVSWTAASVAPSGYSVRWKKDGTTDPMSPINKVTGTSFTIPDLTRGTRYVVRVYTRNAADNGVQANTAVFGKGTPIGLTFSATALTVAEGLSGTYTVGLAAAPSATVTVTVAGWSNTDVTVDTDPGATGNQNTLTFTTTNWYNPKTVTVAAGADVDDNGSDDSVTLTHTAAGGNYASVTGSVAVTVDDDDGPTLSYPALPTVLRAGVQFETLTPMTADFKSGSTFSYAVTTGDLPSGLALDTSTGAISGTPDTPTPTDGSSGASVTVTVTGSTGTGESKQTQTATVTLNFPRIFRFKLPAPTVTLEVGDTQLTANWDAVASADTYALQWKESSVTGWSGTGVTTVDPATPGTVIPGLTNGTSYDVRVRSKAASSSTTHVDGDWSGGVQGMPAVDATFSVTGPATVAEDAGTATYTVTLSKQPAVDVTVKYTTGDGTATAGSDYTAKSDTLTFTTGSWDTAQTVDVTITNDSLDEDDETFTFTLSEPSSGSKLSSSSTVTTTITDNDTRGVTLSETTLTVDEGDSETYTVVLASQPTGNVTVTPTVPENTDISVSPASLTFTNSDWDSPQTVTMTAAEDTDTDTDPAVTITHTVAGADYASVTAGSVTVTVNDDDQSLTRRRRPV